MKKTIYISIIAFIMIVTIFHFHNKTELNTSKNEYLSNSPSIELENILETSIIPEIPEILPEDTIHAAAVQEYLTLMEEKDLPTKKEWFLTYKDLISKYSDNVDPPETLADYYKEDELYLIYYAVETLTEEKTFDNYVLTAEDIFTELEDVSATLEYLYDNDIVSEINTTISPTEDAKLACAYVFEIGL